MGPQHPSTHGVLRLILEIDGETVTEARCGIGYLHTGIEKNLEYRTWTQGTTFVTRMDYLTPFFNETAYCLAVEKLLGIDGPDPGPGHGHPRAADGAQPDLLAPGVHRHRRHGARRHHDHDLRLPRPRADPRHLRADHRPADEPRVHPPRRPRPGPAARRGRPDPRVREEDAARTCRSTTSSPPATRSSRPACRTSATSTWPAAWRSAPPARSCAPPACRTTCASPQPYCGYETYDFDVPTADTCDSYGRFLIRLEEMRAVAADRRAVPGPARSPARSWSPTRRSPGPRSSRSARTASATRSTTSRRSWAPPWRP